jgi:tRNA-splicing ligase RtcB
MSDLTTVRHWLVEPLADDVATAIERVARTDDVQHVAIMPDVHLSHDVCTGLVVATRQTIFPQAVGNDIGCGMAAVRFDASAALLENEHAAATLLAALYRAIPAMRHPRASAVERLPDALADTPLSHAALEKLKVRDGRVQYATLGRGNHFLEFQADDDGFLWLTVHSGSRALGQAIGKHHLQRARRSNTGLMFLDVQDQAGQAYLQDMDWASRYAQTSRLAMLRAVTEIVTAQFDVHADWDSVIHCNHNHVCLERHFGDEFWVHRKGAVSAADGEAGIIPGSMGTATYHVIGRGNDESLCSSSHGAGRRLSRSEARHRIRIDDLERQLDGVWFDHRLAHQLRDEAPAAYKDIHAVMRAQRALTRIVRQCRPVLCYKGA